VIRFGEDLEKYKYEGKLADLTVESVGAFINDFKAGKLKPHLKSEPVPESNDGPVKILVGGNWNDIVADPTKDVLVKYYAPWCGHCKTLAPIWTELGQYVEGLNDVVIAKMDSTANEVTGVAVKSYPTLIWYPKDNKKGVPYQGGRELNDFKEFLNSNSAAYKNWAAGKATAASGV
jgi:protein disulfide isomerase